MAYTQDDLDAVDAAILEYALGKRAGRITIGDHTVEYAQTSVEQLGTLRGLIAAGVSSYAPRTFAKNGGRG